MKNSWKKAIENYFYHYTIHTVIGIIAIFLVISISMTIFQGQKEKAAERNRPPADVEILLYGDFKAEEEKELLDKNLNDLFPDWDIHIETEYVPSTNTSADEIAAQQKGVLTMATVKPDVYIFDRHQFDIYVESDAFLQFTSTFTETIPEELHVSHQTENDEEAHVYAINITNSPIFELKEALETEKLAVVRSGTFQQDNAQILIQRIVETIEAAK